MPTAERTNEVLEEKLMQKSRDNVFEQPSIDTCGFCGLKNSKCPCLKFDEKSEKNGKKISDLMRGQALAMKFGIKTNNFLSDSINVSTVNAVAINSATVTASNNGSSTHDNNFSSAMGDGPG